MRTILTALFTSIALVASPASYPLALLPNPQYLDGETAAQTSAAYSNLPSYSGFGFDISFTGSDSNNLEVALGADLDHDGELSDAETDVTVGWDCGNYFIDRRKISRRFDYPALDSRAERRISYRVGVRNKTATTFDLQTDEGAFGRVVDTNQLPIAYRQDIDWLTVGAERTITWRFLRTDNGSDFHEISNIVLTRAIPGTIPDGAEHNAALAEALGYPQFPCWIAAGSRGGWSSYSGSGISVSMPYPNSTYDVCMRVKEPGDIRFHWTACSYVQSATVRFLVGGITKASITHTSPHGGPNCSSETVSLGIDAGTPPDFVWSGRWDTIRVTSRGLPVAARPGTYRIDQAGGVLMLR